MKLFNILLLIHIVGGGGSLLLGLYLLLARKGDKRHRLLSNIYFYAMLVAALVALPLSIMHPNYFLFIIAVFTAYMLATGKRYLRKKQLTDVTIVDWLLSLMMLLFGLGFMGMGTYKIFNNNNFGIVLLVFGSISLIFVRQDYLNFKGKSSVRNFWLTTHIQRMTASYIASVTAFLVVNNTLLPGVIAWLLPTALLVPLIIKWSRKYERKLVREDVKIN